MLGLPQGELTDIANVMLEVNAAAAEACKPARWNSTVALSAEKIAELTNVAAKAAEGQEEAALELKRLAELGVPENFISTFSGLTL